MWHSLSYLLSLTTHPGFFFAKGHDWCTRQKPPASVCVDISSLMSLHQRQSSTDRANLPPLPYLRGALLWLLMCISLHSYLIIVERRSNPDRPSLNPAADRFGEFKIVLGWQSIRIDARRMVWQVSSTRIKLNGCLCLLSFRLITFSGRFKTQPLNLK